MTGAETAVRAPGPEGMADVAGGVSPGRRVARKWAGYLVRRLAGVAAVLVAIVLLTFMIVRWVPGDPARLIVGINATPDQVQHVREQLGLTQPFWQQFGHYVAGLLRADLGQSFVNSQPVTQMLAQRLPLTAQLAVSALVVVLVVGFLLGVTAGVLRAQRPRPGVHRVVHHGHLPGGGPARVHHRHAAGLRVRADPQVAAGPGRPEFHRDADARSRGRAPARRCARPPGPQRNRSQSCHRST